MTRFLVAIVLGAVALIIDVEAQSTSIASQAPVEMKAASKADTADIRVVQARLISKATYRFAAGY